MVAMVVMRMALWPLPATARSAQMIYLKSDCRHFCPATAKAWQARAESCAGARIAPLSSLGKKTMEEK